MTMNPWVYLVFAGIFEVGFTTFMKLSNNFTNWKYSVSFGACAVLSFSLLAEAMKDIPLGTSYAVWTGIGAVGTAIVGMIFFGDPATLVIAGVIGMKFIAPQA